jgi:hypothetical protein
MCEIQAPISRRRRRKSPSSRSRRSRRRRRIRRKSFRKSSAAYHLLLLLLLLLLDGAWFDTSTCRRIFVSVYDSYRTSAGSYSAALMRRGPRNFRTPNQQVTMMMAEDDDESRRATSSSNYFLVLVAVLIGVASTGRNERSVKQPRLVARVR